jgi:putative transcriptional regulator
MTTKATAREKARFADEMAESFGDLLELGLIDEAAHKLTMRDLNRDKNDVATIVPMTGADVRGLREKARVSQAVLAKYLNLSVDHVSKLERDAVRPTGALLAMLNVIRRKGLEAIL